MPAIALQTWPYTLQGSGTPVAVAGEGIALFTCPNEIEGYFFGPTSEASIPDVLHDANAQNNESLTVPTGVYLYLVGPQGVKVGVTAQTPPA